MNYRKLRSGFSTSNETPPRPTGDLPRRVHDGLEEGKDPAGEAWRDGQRPRSYATVTSAALEALLRSASFSGGRCGAEPRGPRKSLSRRSAVAGRLARPPRRDLSLLQGRHVLVLADRLSGEVVSRLMWKIQNATSGSSYHSTT